MDRAVAVARYFLKLAESEPESEPVTHMRLQKLLYYAQGWSLAARSRPLFESKIEAWTHGPVVRSVYPTFADYKGNSIPPHEAYDPETLSREDKALIQSVWAGYRHLSAAGLRAKSHHESPWTDARGTLGPDAFSDAEITSQSMQDYFTKLYETESSNTLPISDFIEADKEFRSGGGSSLTDVITRLRDAI